MVKRQVLESVDPLGAKIWVTYDDGKKVALTRHFVHPINPEGVYETRDYNTRELLSTTQAFPDIAYHGAKLYKTTDSAGKVIAETRHIKEPLNPEGVYKTWIYSGGTEETRHTPFALNPPGTTVSTEKEIPYGIGVIAFEENIEERLKKEINLTNNESPVQNDTRTSAQDDIDTILEHDRQVFPVSSQVQLEALSRNVPPNFYCHSEPDEYILVSHLQINYLGFIGGAVLGGTLGFGVSLALVFFGSLPLWIIDELMGVDTDGIFNAILYGPTIIGTVVGAMQGGFTSDGVKRVKNPEYKKH